MNETFPSIFNDVIGPVMRGPSSSHVAAAARIGDLLRQMTDEKLESVVAEFDVNGSLAESHDGHGTDMGFICGVVGVPLTDERVDKYWDLAEESGIDVEFKISDYGAVHPNFYRITAKYDGGKTFLMDAISTGGGMIEIQSVNGFKVEMLGDYYEACLILADSDEESTKKAELFCKENITSFEKIACSVSDERMMVEIKTSKKLSEKELEDLNSILKPQEIYLCNPILPTLSTAEDFLPFHSIAELIEYNKYKNLKLWELAAIYESKRGSSSVETVLKQMSEIVDLLTSAVENGLSKKYYGDRILGSQAYMMNSENVIPRLIPGDVMNTVIKYITAVMETKSSMGVIVASPTAGSCGCLPGTILGTAKALGKSKDDIVKAMLSAGLIGVFFTKQATFAAEVGGCQMECGAGSGMAAAGLAELMGGTANEALDAAAFALQGLTGLACDPVANRVEVPCLNKNIVGGMNALSSANVILSGFDKVIPLDEVIDAMYDIGCQLPLSLRCTFGGLGKTKTSMAIRRKLEEKKRVENFLNNRDRELAVLRAVNDNELPVGAIYLSEALDIPPASIGRILTNLEKNGFLKKESNKGRTITERGKKYLGEKNILNTKISAAKKIIKSQSASDISTLKEILELRRLMEGYSAMRCAERCTEEEVSELESIQREYVDELKCGGAGSEQDLRLHLKIAEFSGNVTLTNLLKLILTDNGSYESFSQAALYRNRLYLDEHEAIIAAIKQKYPKRAKTEMERHIGRVMKNTLGGL